MKTDLRLLNVTDTTNDSLAGLSDSILSSDYSSVIIAENLVYNEMSDFPVSSRSELDILQENTMVLKDLSERLSFLSKEIKYLMNIK
jgi:hypothetical protein